MNPSEVFEKLDQCIMSLSKGNTEQKTLGIKKSEAQRDYRIKYNQKMLQLKLDKCQASLIIAFTKNDPEVAQLEMQKDIAESAYFTCISAIENLRLEIEVLRTKVSWLKSEMNNS